MSRRESRRGPRELEAVVLGLLATDGPATPYAVRQYFLRSPSPTWSGSAGAIYPLIRRLRRRGLVATESSRTGKRRSDTCRITPAGRRALREWLLEEAGAHVVGVPPDPLRVRVAFLSTLAPHERRAVIADAVGRAREHLKEIARDLAARRTSGDRPGGQVARGALLMMRARVRWLEELLRES
jgi:DNA-binding PadR family transcriptional regulator